MNLGPFKLSALETLAKIIGDRYTGTEITEFFRKAGFPEFIHDGGTKWRFVYASLETLQNQKYGPFNIVKIIEQLCDPQEYFLNPELHASICIKVNNILSFYGLHVGEDGKVRTLSEKATTIRKPIQENEKIFDERQFHSKIIQHARKLFIEGNYFHAVFECCKVYNKEVREKSRIEDDGASLMSKAFSLSGPLKLNTQRTDTERNEQEGIMHLSRGIMSAIRNPQAHEPALNWPITLEDALDLLSFLSFLFRKLDKATYFKKD